MKSVFSRELESPPSPSPSHPISPDIFGDYYRLLLSRLSLVPTTRIVCLARADDKKPWGYVNLRRLTGTGESWVAMQLLSGQWDAWQLTCG